MLTTDGEKDHLEKPNCDLAIVVVHWRVPELLHSCLTSLARERNRSDLSINIVVVDTDVEPTQTREVASTFYNVDCLEIGTKPGYAAGCNAGIRATSSQAVLLLNPDTVILDGALDRMWQILFMSDHIGLVAPLLLNPDGTIQSSGYRFPGIVNTFLDLYPLHPRLIDSSYNGRVDPGNAGLPVAIDYPLGAAMMVKRSAIEEAGALDEDYFMYCEEIDFAKRLEVRGWTRLLVPDARIIHHGGQSTKQLPHAMHEALWRSRAKYHWRWSGRTQQMLQSWIVGTAFGRGESGESEIQRQANDRIVEAFRNREVGLV